MSHRARTQKKPPKSLPKLHLALNSEQKIGAQVIQDSTITYIQGKAGSGKTLLALHEALNALHGNVIDTIFITRPAVLAQEDIGYLPGNIKEKMDPYLIPIYDNLIKLYPNKEGKTGLALVEKYMENMELEIAPIGFMRGRTFVNSYLILDEAQNITVEQLKMAMTRIGKGTKMIIVGDINQCDLKQNKHSGLFMLDRLEEKIPFLNKVELYENHRDPIVQQLLDAFEF